ncbi:hypothetical protein DDZ14_18305 [Maritimibacter sp. 55A14]|uniref:COG4223 family protein n=1 Tax=Maritimibacter sp. 55A14 TaxID=2174844 RepID=UPI000D61CE12|nr:mitofilin family membrane protein [Maritimibacter sp. 55A14]PWE28865.1 hypothetical protein DDZ14_18305 [Maritimibacter sp. 55A14]
MARSGSSSGKTPPRKTSTRKTAASGPGGGPRSKTAGKPEEEPKDATAAKPAETSKTADESAAKSASGAGEKAENAGKSAGPEKSDTAGAKDAAAGSGKPTEAAKSDLAGTALEKALHGATSKSEAAAKSGGIKAASATVKDEKKDEKPAATRNDNAGDATPASGGSGGGASGAKAAPTPAPERRGGFFALLLGGVAAAAIGFGMARYVLPEGWPLDIRQSGETEAAEARVALEARISDLEEALAAARTAPVEPADTAALQADLGARIDEATGGLTAGLSDLSSRVAALEETLDTQADRLDALESQGLGGGEGGADAAAALGAYREEMSALRAALDEQQAQNAALAEKVESAAADAEARIAEAEARVADLAASAQAADAAVAISRLRANVDAGQPYAAALDDLARAAQSEPPDVLAAHAQGGVANMAQLRARFPDAARAGLSASLAATVDDDAASRVMAFLRSQVGARSLDPREGGDPDAVLSRAEAALDNGDLGAALTELDGLPEEGRAAMAGWLDQARARQEVLDALNGFAASVGQSN